MDILFMSKNCVVIIGLLLCFEISMSEQVASFANLLNEVQSNTKSLNRERRYFFGSGLEPEASMTTCEIIRYHDYPCEEHEITTADGYIIKIHRIPRGKNASETATPGQPVILQHGFACSSSSWVLNIGDQNFPNILADAGYDAWITNVRGNDYGLRHTILTPDDDEFWDFSFQEMAEYDMPATIDYILEKTNYTSVYYVGHSMGTTILFAMLASRKDYNSKVKAGFAMAPVTSFVHARTSVINYLTNSYTVKYLQYMAPGPLFSDGVMKTFKSYAASMCSSSFQLMCSNGVFSLVGHSLYLNESRIPIILQHIPAKTSINTLLHTIQMKSGGKPMSRYDFGTEENIIHYDQPTAPHYNLSEVTAPIMLMSGKNDMFVNDREGKSLAPKFRSLIKHFTVPLKAFTHFDFLTALNARRVLYDEVMKTMKDMSRRNQA